MDTALALPFGRTRAVAIARAATLLAGLTLAAMAIVVTSDRSGMSAGHAVPLRQSLATLTPDARGPVSSALGRLQPAYQVHGLRAVNAAQSLTATFAADGASIRSGGGVVAIGLQAVGRSGALRTVSLAAAAVDHNRVLYRGPSVTEWYANGPLGLEQGFDISRAPAGTGELTLVQRLTGDLTARRHGATVTLTGHGVHLAYAGLVARDAEGRRLPATLTLAGRRLLIRVDDRGAAYPVHIDPMFQQAQLSASGGASNDSMGWSVAVSGNTIVAGAPGHNGGVGSVYVFVEPATGWGGTTSPTARLTAADGVANDELGYAVAISGNTIVASAPYHQVGANTYQGNAYIYVKPTTGNWASTSTPAAELTSSDGAGSDMFGASVGISGATVVIGAPSHQVGANAAQGEAYVYTEPAAGWQSGTETARLTAGDGGANDTFGSSVAVDGSTVVVGSPGHAVGANAGEGTAYVYAEPAGGWTAATETAQLTPSNGVGGDKFGKAVAISGNTIAVGAPNHVNASGAQGATYVYVAPSTGWVSTTETASLSAGDGRGSDGFGHAVAIDGSEIVAGSHFRANGCSPAQGAVYGYAEPAGGWATTSTQTTEYIASNGEPNDLLGDAVGVSGATIAGGEPFKNVGTTAKVGATDVFSTTPAPVMNTALPKISGNLHYGQTISVAPGSWTTPDTLNYTYQWQRCYGGVPSNISGATGPTYTLQKADENLDITVLVTATDQEAQSSQAEATPVGPIGIQLPPSNSTPPVISGTAQDGQQVTTTTGTWSSPTLLTYVYNWIICDSTGCHWQPTQRTPQWTVPAAAVGKQITVVVTATDPQGQTGAGRAQSVGPVAPPPPPSNTTPPSVGGTPTDGQTLTADPGQWTSPDKLTYTYQWQRCDSTGATCNPIATATHPTYRQVAADVNHMVTVTVTAHDQSGQTGGPLTATPVGPVAAPAPPNNTTAPSISGTPAVGQVLTANHGIWSSPDTLAYAYQWLRCGTTCSAISGATHSTYTTTSADSGNTLEVTVKATDQEHQSTYATSSQFGPIS